MGGASPLLPQRTRGEEEFGGPFPVELAFPGVRGVRGKGRSRGGSRRVGHASGHHAEVIILPVLSRTVELFDLDLPVDPRVYPPREDSLLLAQTAEVHPGEPVVEVGCGSGLASLSAARSGGRVLATDVNPYALQALRRTARERGLSISLARADLFSGLRRFDVVLFNPPYLPSLPAGAGEDLWDRWALDGGPDGQGLLRRWLRELPEHLAPAGRAYLLFAEVPPSGGLPETLPFPLRGLRARRLGESRLLEGERLSVWEILPHPSEGTGAQACRAR